MKTHAMDSFYDGNKWNDFQNIVEVKSNTRTRRKAYLNCGFSQKTFLGTLSEREIEIEASEKIYHY